MTFEAFHGGNEELNLKNELQTALALKASPNGEDFGDWIDANAPKFAAVLEQTKKENPNYINDWHNNREEFIRTIEEKMAAAPPLEKAA